MYLGWGCEIGTARIVSLARACAVLGCVSLLSLAARAQLPKPNDQSYYDNVRPQLDQPLPDILKAIPELQGLQPALNQDELPSILSKTGDVTEDLMAGMQNLVSTENVIQSKPARKGRGTDQRQSRFDYLIVVHRIGATGTLEEYRTGAEWVGLRGVEEGYTLTRGFASAWLRFLPLNQRETRFLHLGQQTQDGRQCYVVAFAQIPKLTSVPAAAIVGETSVVILHQGIAWIDAANYRIVRMRIDLLAPRPDIDLDAQTTDLHFGETRLPGIPSPLWLPQEARVTTRMDNRLYQNIHRYSDYRVFKVESKILPISPEPSIPAPGGGPAQAQASTSIHVPAQIQAPTEETPEISKAEGGASALGQDDGSKPHAQADSAQLILHEDVVKSRRRVVRVYLEVGEVRLKQPGSAVDERILVNTPIEEGAELSTSAHSDAIIEFENASTAILGQGSQLLFHQLTADTSGNKQNGMTLEQGSATFHFLPEHHSLPARNRDEMNDSALSPSAQSDVFEVKIADIVVTADRKCRFRADIEGDHIRVEVFSGNVLVATPTMASTVSRGSAMEHISGGTEAAFDIHKAIRKDNWDQWAEAQELRLLSGTGSATDPTGSSRATLPDSPSLR